MSLEEWRQALIISGNEDEYVIEKINEMIDSLSELNDSTETDGLEKINKLLEEAGWRFFDNENSPANIQLEANVKLTKKQIDDCGENFEKIKNG